MQSSQPEKIKLSDLELQLRKLMNIEQVPELSHDEIIRQLGSFWPHFALHRRLCDLSKKNIISIYSENCPYPVWHKDLWMSQADPISAEVDFNQNIFPQLWRFFSKSAIPHNTGVNNENCEYTDDWFFSRNCYLSHSGTSCEDVRYSYRTRNCRDCMDCAFLFDCELCFDLINCRKCFNSICSINCREVFDSAFMYDCRNCSNCLFCYNLRNKKFCIANRQYTKEQYQEQLAKINFSSRVAYDEAKNKFKGILKNLAWHRALIIDNCENSSGNFLENANNCEDCFFVANSEDCVNSVRSVSGNDKNCLNALGHFGGELIYYSALAQDACYDVKFCANVIKSKFLEYCMHCYQCENCFGCCGLVNKKFFIFNKQYSEIEYHELKAKIISKMKLTNEYGQFFPGYFAAVPYEETWSAIHFPLSVAQQIDLMFRVEDQAGQVKPKDAFSCSEIPDLISDQVLANTYWDDDLKKPFRITKEDLIFCKKMKVPMPNSYYIKRLKENYSWLTYNGKNQKAVCANTGVVLETNLLKDYQSKVLSEAAYLKLINT